MTPPWKLLKLLHCMWYHLICALQGGQKCGESNNFWEYYEEDIARVVALNSTCFRLSLGAACTPSSHTMPQCDASFASMLPNHTDRLPVLQHCGMMLPPLPALVVSNMACCCRVDAHRAGAGKNRPERAGPLPCHPGLHAQVCPHPYSMLQCAPSPMLRGTCLISARRLHVVVLSAWRQVLV